MSLAALDKVSAREGQTIREGQTKTIREGQTKTIREGQTKTIREGQTKTIREGQTKTIREGQTKTIRDSLGYASSLQRNERPAAQQRGKNSSTSMARGGAGRAGRHTQSTMIRRQAVERVEFMFGDHERRRNSLLALHSDLRAQGDAEYDQQRDPEEDEDEAFNAHFSMIRKRLDELDSFNRSTSLPKRSSTSRTPSPPPLPLPPLSPPPSASRTAASPPPLLSIPSRTTSHPSHLFSLAPKLVIKATHSSSRTDSPASLPYSQGSFYYVLDERPATQEYEVMDPVSRNRGLVPKPHFAVVAESSSAPPILTPSSSTFTNPPPSLSYTPLTTSLVQDKDLDNTEPPEIDEASSFSSTLISIDVPIVSLDAVESKWKYTLHLTLVSGKTRILHRTFAQFTSLHLHLLSQFPHYAGYYSTPRILPFLPPQRALDEDGVEVVRVILAFYLDALLFTCPSALSSSQAAQEFLKVAGTGDLETDMTLSFSAAYDSSAALFDLISHVSTTFSPSQTSTAPLVSVRFELGELVYSWSMPANTTYAELRDEIGDQLGFDDFEDVLYRDEAGEMIIIYGDEDLRPLLVLDAITLFCS